MAYHLSAAQRVPPAGAASPTASRRRAGLSRFFLPAGLVFLALVIWGGLLPSQPVAAGPPPLVFSTGQSVIYYETPEDLITLARRLGLVQGGPLGAGELKRLADRIDGMLAEIQRVLKVAPLKPVTLTIRLLPDRVKVQQQQELLARRPQKGALASRGPLLSFYDPEARTIYVSLADVHIGVLAHEMTHFVLCESSSPRPGVDYQESLAQYLEKRFLTGKSHELLAPLR